MPLVDSNDPALWDGGPGSLYRAFPNGTQIGFVRAGKSVYLGLDADALLAALLLQGFVQGQRIALVGAGYGWVAERFNELGFGPIADGTANGKICSVDTSTFIQANKGANAVVPIINADVNAATGRQAIRQQFGAPNAEVHWVVTEDVLPILIGPGPTPSGNNEIVPFCNNLRTLASTGVAHWVSVGTPSSDPRLNWKTAQEWKNWVTPDFVIQRGTSTVL